MNESDLLARVKVMSFLNPIERAHCVNNEPDSSGQMQLSPIKCKSSKSFKKLFEMKKRRRRQNPMHYKSASINKISKFPLFFITLFLVSICDITLQQQQTYAIDDSTTTTTTQQTPITNSRQHQEQISIQNNNNNQINVKIEEETNAINSASQRLNKPSSMSASSNNNNNNNNQQQQQQDFIEPTQVLGQAFGE